MKIKIMKKRILSLVLAMLILLSAIPMPAFAASKDTPIANAAQLAAWDGNSNIYLTQDIDLTGTTWVTSHEIATNVVLDGRGHKITGITLTTGVDDGYGGKYYGLFTNLSGIVKNLGLEGTITASETEGTIRAGLLAATCGNNYSNVLNCYAVGSIAAPNYPDQTSQNLRLGGLLGSYSNGTIQNCYSATQGAALTGSVPMFSCPTDSYYDSTLFTGTNPEEFGGSATPKTTEEMQSQAFVDLLNEKRDFVGTTEGQANNEGNEWGFTENNYPNHVPFREKVLVEITNEAELRAIANDLSGKYLLKNDIQLTTPWTPLGITAKPFKGNFDGGGHTITGLNVDAIIGDGNPDDDNQRGTGLFGCSTGTIKNLGVDGTVASNKYYDRIGGIVGRNKGRIENCFAKVKLISNITDNNLYAAAGIAGENTTDGTIQNCYAVATIDGKVSNTNGAVAKNNGILSNIYFDKTVYNRTDWGAPKEAQAQTTEYLQSPIFAKLLNTNRGDGSQWTLKADSYPTFGNDAIPDIPALAGTVTITGTAKVGEILTATPANLITTDGLNYQWLLTKDGKTRTVGSNSSKYIPAISEVGGTVIVKITSSIQEGSIESAASQAILENATATSTAKANKTKALHNNIAFSFINSSDPWEILEMVAAGQKANLTAIDKFIEDSVKVFSNPNLQATEDEKYIMALSSLGIDATNVPLGDKRINGVAAMAAKKLDGTNLLIFALPAYDSGNYTIPQNAALKRSQIVTELLNRQSQLGDWTLSGTGADPDMTAMAIQGLAPIYLAPIGSYEGVSAQLQQQVIKAVDLAVARLSTLQVAETSWGSDYRGAFQNQANKTNANSTSMVICALSALGINPDTDYRFIKNGKSAVDGLLCFATKTEDGFGFTNNKKQDSMATEQGFRALLSHEGITAANGLPYNIYKLGKITPTPPPTNPDPNPGDKPSQPDKQISASIRIIGDTAHANPTDHTKYVNWFKTTSFKLDEGSSVYDLFMLAINDAGLAQEGAENNYVKSIKAPLGYGGHWLGEFDNGQNSGWMYLINNNYPDVGLKSQTIKDGDVIIWHYVDDYTLERDKQKWQEAKDDNPPTNPNSNQQPTVKPSDKQEVITPQVTADKNGNATVTISPKDTEAALAAIKKNNAKELVIAPQITGDTKKVQVSLAKTAIAELANNTKAALTVESKVAKISLSTAALSTIAKQSGSDVKITVEKIDTTKMSAENQKLVGDHPVYDFSIYVDDNKVTEFGGKITISLPYTPKQGEDLNKLTIYYIDKDGNPTEMVGAKYDKASKSLIFETNHFSNFAIVYNQNKIVFSDVREQDWFYNAVRFVVDQNLFTGTTATTFSPNADMNRSMLWKVLYRLAGSPNKTENSNWYADAQKWTITNNISDGSNPQGEMTRSELAAMLYRYANLKKYDLTPSGDLSKFTDTAKLADWAKTPMSWAVGSGIITGRTTTTLAADGNVTRAEVATMLQRFMNTVAK